MPTDTPERLNYRKMERITRQVCGLLVELDGRELRRRKERVCDTLDLEDRVTVCRESADGIACVQRGGQDERGNQRRGKFHHWNPTRPGLRIVLRDWSGGRRIGRNPSATLP